MIKIPREIDELMWEVAEHNDQAMIDDFGSRYPDYRVELGKRIRIVNDFKGSRPNSSPKQFTPAAKVRSLGPSRLAIAGITTLVIASVGFAAFSIAYIYDQRQPAKSQPLEETPNFLPSEPETVPAGENFEPRFGQVSEDDRPIINHSETFDPLMVSVSVEESDIMLSRLIGNISLQTGLTLMLAPGFEDVRIKARYLDSPLIYVLRDLGQTFGFTPMVQTQTSVLLVPAIDPNAPRFVELPGSEAEEVVSGESTENLNPAEPEQEAPEEEGNKSEIIIRPSNSGDGIEPAKKKDE